MDKQERDELFVKLHGDIQEYLRENLRSEEYYKYRRANEDEDERVIKAKIRSGERVSKLVQVSSTANVDRWQEYKKHKKSLSFLCGDDAPANRHDQEQFDNAIDYLVECLQL